MVLVRVFQTIAIIYHLATIRTHARKTHHYPTHCWCNTIADLGKQQREL
jgi:hypothetical protein